MQRLEFHKKCISKSEIIYSVPVGPEKKGETRVHRHPDFATHLKQIPLHIKNLADFWDESLSKFPSNLALEQITYKQLDGLAKSVGSWLHQNKHQKIYFYAKNSPQWTISDVACWNYAIVNIPLYDTLGSQAFAHILKLTQGTAIFSTNELTSNLFNNLSVNKQKVKTIVYLDIPSAQNIAKLKSLSLQVLTFKQLTSHKPLPRPSANLQTHLTYSFTSGTTGLPKGVIGTHRSTISQVSAMKGFYQYSDKDVHLSFLPIAHTFQRMVTWTVIHFGAQIKYSHFPIAEITKDFARAKPTSIPMVPRLLNKLYPACKAIYDKEKSSAKIKGLFGGRLRLIVTGSAPISPEILTFFQKTLQCDLREGYGQTQTTAATFVTRKGDTNYGHVGGPNGSVQFKLVDVPQMNCLTSSNPSKGEVCNRGDSVFKGYYLDQKNTQQTIDSEGWNHSGDIGIILPNGSLKIVDRKKNIYKLSQGQYIAPEKVQNIYLRCPYVAECFLYGDSLKDFNVAVIHPNLDVLLTVAKKFGIEETDHKKLTQNKQLQAFILKEMTEHGKKEGLLGFQLAKKVKLWPVSFGTLGIFTSTMKLQRHTAKLVFNKEIQQMYKNS